MTRTEETKKEKRCKYCKQLISDSEARESYRKKYLNIILGAFKFSCPIFSPAEVQWMVEQCLNKGMVAGETLDRKDLKFDKLYFNWR